MNFQKWDMVNISSIFGPRFDRVNIFYSNPDYYTEQKYKESIRSSSSVRSEDAVEWPVKTDDFFPYSDCPNCFWTGYFTSRTAFKRFERVASSFLLAARQIDALLPTAVEDLSSTASESSPPLYLLEDNLGVAQHHDAVSGTAKQHVSDDYSQKLSAGIHDAAKHVIDTLKRYMLLPDSMHGLDNLDYCPLLNETICDLTMVRKKLHLRRWQMQAPIRTHLKKL
jgi:alpha-mannosidase